MRMPWATARHAEADEPGRREATAPPEELEPVHVGPAMGWEPGHYYSPVASVADRQRAARSRRPPAAVDMRPDEQVSYARTLDVARPTGPRWHPDNDMFAAAEAALYRAMLLRHKPRRVLEVGSGFSTALALDVADAHLPGLELVCVEPYADRLRSRLLPGDAQRLTLHEHPLQDIRTADLIAELEPGDFLFVDSTHVAKAASDVLELFLHVLPALPDGVLVHVHDIYWPFEYPDDWLAAGRDWNEAYFLHAFLAYNERFRILLFQNWLARERPGVLPSEFGDGSSLWLEKVPR